MCVNNLSKVALDSAAAGIEPAISSRAKMACRSADDWWPFTTCLHVNYLLLIACY